MGIIHTFSHFLETYAGEKSAVATKRRGRKLAHARRLEEKGTSPEGIRQQTGWFRNPYDNQWRFEISDWQIKYKTITYDDRDRGLYTGHDDHIIIALPNFIEATSLFNDYPALREVRVSLTADRSNSAATGRFMRNANMIAIFQVKSLTYADLNWSVRAHKIGNQNPERGAVLAQKQKEPLYELSFGHKLIFIHELQHAIQFLEGFPRGGNPGDFQPVVIDSMQSRLNKLHDRYLKKYPKYRAAFDAAGLLNGQPGQLESPEMELLDRLALETGYMAARAKLVSKPMKDKIITPQQQYHHLAGEIESRDVEARYHLTGDAAYVVYDVRYSEPTWAGADTALGSYNTRAEAERGIVELSKRVAAKYLDIMHCSVTRRTYPPLTSEPIKPQDVITKF